MGNVRCDHHPPRFNLDPIAIALINDMVVKFNKSADARVFMHAELYQLMIYAARKKFL
jgi:hypothetical protein